MLVVGPRVPHLHRLVTSDVTTVRALTRRSKRLFLHIPAQDPITGLANLDPTRWQRPRTCVVGRVSSMSKKPAPYNTGPGRRYDAISGQNRAKNRVFSVTRQKAFLNVQNARPREASGTKGERARWKHLTKGPEPKPQVRTRARG